MTIRKVLRRCHPRRSLAGRPEGYDSVPLCGEMSTATSHSVDVVAAAAPVAVVVTVVKIEWLLLTGPNELAIEWMGNVES